MHCRGTEPSNAQTGSCDELAAHPGVSSAPSLQPAVRKKREIGVVRASGLGRRSVCLSELRVCSPAVSKYPTPSLLLGGAEGQGGEM